MKKGGGFNLQIEADGLWIRTNKLKKDLHITYGGKTATIPAYQTGYFKFIEPQRVILGVTEAEVREKMEEFEVNPEATVWRKDDSNKQEV